MTFRNRRFLSAVVICALVFATFETTVARKLQALKIDCCEDGFKLDSSLLTIDIKKGDVKIKSPLGDAHFTKEGTVIDSPLLQVNTLERVRVEVANGELLNITSADDGSLDLSIGKDGAVATLSIEPDGKGVGKIGKEEIVVDFSDEDGAITVDVGKNGKIVDVDTDGDGNARVRVGKDGKVAKLDVSGGNFKLVLGSNNDDNKKKKGGEDGNQEGATKSKNKAEKGDGDEKPAKTGKTVTKKKTVKEVKKGDTEKETNTGDGGEPESEGEVDAESVAIVRLMGTKVVSAEVEEVI